jgi:hypothetical protein
MDTEKQSEQGPEYLQHWPGLYVREGNQVVEAPAEDSSLARGYPRWPAKGPVQGGRRLTIMTRKTSYQPGEAVRVIHVVEFTEPGHDAYIMGPKPVYGEYVDDQLATPPPPEGDPLVPLDYDGATLPSPAVDYNYEITSYTFDQPGMHQIFWRLDTLQSNVLTLTVEERAG